MLCMWQLQHCFDLPHLCIHTHTHTHTHTYIDTHKYTSSWDNTGSQNLIQAKFQFFNENIRSNKDSGQTEKNKLKYLHYLNKMIENARWGGSILVKFNVSSQNYFKGFAWILNDCIRVLVYSDFLLQILLVWKQPLETLVKSWKISYEEVYLIKFNKFNEVKRF